MTTSDPTPGDHYPQSADVLAELDRLGTVSPLVYRTTLPQIVQQFFADAATALRTEQSARQIAEAEVKYRRGIESSYQAALQGSHKREDKRRSERDTLQQRIDAAKKMLLSIIDGLSYVDFTTDPVVIASTTLDEIQAIRAALTAPTESKEPDHDAEERYWGGAGCEEDDND